MTLLPGIDPFPGNSEARVRASSAWYTPPEAADAVAAACWASVARDGWRILEPAAGHGALLAALFRADAHSAARVDAVELDARAADVLRETMPKTVAVECCDYLTRPAPSEPYDLAVLNPPYERGLDSAFMAKAMDESLRVVALVRLAMLESQRSHERVWSRMDSEWRLISLCPFVSRPVFLPGGGESDGGKTAFMLVKMTRVPRVADAEPRETSVRWL